jgi:solute carrier family 41
LNPDNVATPFAASIGDVVSLLVLSSWASLLFSIHGQYHPRLLQDPSLSTLFTDDYPEVMISILGVYILLILPIWIFIVRKNNYTKKILTHGWTPVLSALIISG